MAVSSATIQPLTVNPALRTSDGKSLCTTSACNLRFGRNQISAVSRIWSRAGCQPVHIALLFIQNR